MSDHPHVLIATLGGQPQVVTFTLDLLLQQGFPISEVIVVHPAATDPRLQHSIGSLNVQFVGDRYHFNEHSYPCPLRKHVLRFNGDPLDDITDGVSATGTFDTIHYLIRDLKQQNRHIHLSVTGGRRLMSLLAISSALLHFHQNIDHIWHLYTPQEIQEQAKAGALMHVAPNAGTHLIELPFVPWGQYFPNLLLAPDATAQTVLDAQVAKMDAEQQRRCGEVVRQATSRQREVLRAFAQGLNLQEVSRELNISIRTVDGHKTKLLELCREVWDIDENARLGYHFLYKTFAQFPIPDA